MNTVFLRLEGHLQSWGERGRWFVRDTAKLPTKSGVIGLLGAALGIADESLVTLQNSLRMGIRVDKSGSIIQDYHTITSGVMMAKGGVKGGEGDEQTVVTNRFYLADASFLVALQGDGVTVRRCALALQSPAWLLYLGRHCCMPSAPIYAGMGNYPTLRDALNPQPGQLIEIEGGSMLRNDAIASVLARRFAKRAVERVTA